MKKKILALCLVVVLGITAVTGVTLAYFTDTDYNKNVMVTGNVKIDQIEKDRNGNDFKDGKTMFPVSKDYDGTATWIANEKNLIDKFVTVKNEGSTAAYVRTLVAFEAGPADGKASDGKTYYNGDLFSKAGTSDNYTYVHFLHNGGNEVKFNPVNDDNGGETFITIDGVRYVVGVAYYNNSKATDSEGEKISALEAGATTDPSLQYVWLKSSAGNEFYDFVGAEYDILVLSQAVQTEGFADAESAFDAAFGKMTADNLTNWFTTYTTSKGVSAEQPATN